MHCAWAPLGALSLNMHVISAVLNVRDVIFRLARGLHAKACRHFQGSRPSDRLATMRYTYWTPARQKRRSVQEPQSAARSTGVRTPIFTDCAIKLQSDGIPRTGHAGRFGCCTAAVVTQSSVVRPPPVQHVSSTLGQSHVPTRGRDDHRSALCAWSFRWASRAPALHAAAAASRWSSALLSFQSPVGRCVRRGAGDLHAVARNGAGRVCAR